MAALARPALADLANGELVASAASVDDDCLVGTRAGLNADAEA